MKSHCQKTNTIHHIKLMRENKKKMKMKKKSRNIWKGCAYVCTAPRLNNKDVKRIKREID